MQKNKKVIEGREVFCFSSPVGYLECCITGNQLYSLYKVPAGLRSVQKLSPFAQSVKKQFEKYFSGKLTQFRIPLAERGTVFQRRVWQVLQNIGYGQTQTYQEVARHMGYMRGGARPVGQSCARNPFLIVVPCHRVVAQQGLGGYAGGLSVKKALLSLEQKGYIK